MRRSAILFFLAILAPSLVLGVLALRSVQSQQLAFERQEQQLAQGLADKLADAVRQRVLDLQREFAQLTDRALAAASPADLKNNFDDQLRPLWPLAQVGFVVDTAGQCYSPSLFGPAESRRFRLANELFLCNRESVEVVWNGPKGRVNLSELDAAPAAKAGESKSVFATRAGASEPAGAAADAGSRSFQHIVAGARLGTMARFVQDELTLLFWYRPTGMDDLTFGARVALSSLGPALLPAVQIEPEFREEFYAVLRDDNARRVAQSSWSPPEDQRAPLAATEIGEMLPHWRVALYPRHADRAGLAASAARRTTAAVVATLLLAIAAGGWLIAQDVHRHLTLARQKTDFVSNITHELKTPLTSIRMFTELLARDPELDPAKRRQFLEVIGAECARLTRLINHVLDFARRERCEMRYRFEWADLGALVRQAVGFYHPQFAAGGCVVNVEVPGEPVEVKVDAEAVSQALMNLFSNAEKYSETDRHIDIRLRRSMAQGPGNGGWAMVEVLDRGPGVPAGCEMKIFEQFYRAHDSLASGIPGSGLGLTIARQVARAHGGDVTYTRREGGGSCFELRLPIAVREKT